MLISVAYFVEKSYQPKLSAIFWYKIW